MDLFENVNIDIDTSGTGRIMVEEKKFWRLRTGLRFDEFHLGEGYVEPAYENCFGLGIVALLHLQYGLRREKYTLDVIGNHLSSRNIANNIQLQLYSSKEKIQEIVEIDTVLSDTTSSIETTSLRLHTLRKTGLNFYIGTQLGRFTMLSLGMRLERFRILQRDTDILGDIFGLSFKNTLPYFSLKLTMDSMDKYPFPTSGLRQYFSIGGANSAFGGKYSFIKCTGSIGRYFSFFKNHTIFPQFSFSWANDVLPEVERAYIGGAIPEERYQELSVYNYIPFFGLPPRAMIGDMFGISHIEYRCEIKKNLFLYLLFDWGTTWDKDTENYGRLIEDAPLGIGIGLAYNSIIGPIRFSYGQLLKNSERYLSEGSEFFYFSAGHDF
jgi:outer membrane protein assembly factor BamA